MPVGAGLATVGSSIASGVVGSNAASSAAQAAQAASAANNATATNVYNTNTANLNPYITAGTSANSTLSGLLGTGGNAAQSQSALNTYLNSENYQFQLGQGENAVKTANATDFDSGATAKALNTYAQGTAGTALAGYEGQLDTQAGLGEGAASSLGSLGTSFASQIASDNNNAAGVTGTADLASANSISSALKAITQGGNAATTQSSFGNSGGTSALSNVASGVGNLANFATSPLISF